MKRLFFVKVAFLILGAGLILSSCTTKAQPLSYADGYQLTGMEAADFYGEKLLEEESLELRYNYCYSLFEGKNYSTCLMEAKAAQAIYPDYIRFRYLQILSSERLEDKKNYLEALTNTLDLNPVDMEVLHRLLAYYEDENEMEEATQVAKELLQLDKKDEAAIGYLAKTSDFYLSLSNNFSAEL